MIYTTISPKALELFEHWLISNYPDIDLVEYYDFCDWADVLTEKVIEPLRKRFLGRVYTHARDEVEAIQILYKMLIHYDEEEDELNHMATELLIEMIDEHGQPHHSKIKVLDHLGRCVCYHN